jgi:hypothetical protein
MVFFHLSAKSIRIPDLRMLFYHFRFKSIQRWNLITIPIDSKVTFSFSWILRMVFCHLSAKSIRIPYFRMLFYHFRFKTIRKWNLITINTDSKVTFSFYWILRMVFFHLSAKSIRIPDLRMLFYHFRFKSIQKWNLITIPIDSKVTFSFSWILRMI